MRIVLKSTLFIFLSVFCVHTLFAQASMEESVDKFRALLYHINSKYVDSVDNNKLVEDAIVGILDKLDPHSVYIPKDELESMNEPLKGNFEGIGIQFNILRDTIFVVSPISGGPSEKVGIRANDRIVAVDGENVAGIGIKNSDVQRLLKGHKDTKVTVGIYRDGSKKILDFNITRDKIPIYSVDAWYMSDDEVGYIKLNRFAATTKSEMAKAFDDLKAQGMKSLILDLQGNGGGYLQTAIELADEFLKQDQLIVFTEGRAYPKDETNATNWGHFEEGKLVILIDEGSASASEIVSGAVQDWDRGLIIGRRSFGKGLVQKPIPLPDGSALRLTTQKYYTPSGRCIQKSYEEGKEAYQKEKYDRLLNGELISLDSLEFPDSLKFYTQNNRTVYGGGGILPDVFVALDTSFNSDYYSDIVRKGIHNNFVLEIMSKEREKYLSLYPNVEAFIKEFDVTKEVMPEFFEFALEAGVEFDKTGYETSQLFLDTRVKGLIARNLWDNSAYYKIVNPILPAYSKAMEVLSDDTFLKLKLANK